MNDVHFPISSNGIDGIIVYLFHLAFVHFRMLLSNLSYGFLGFHRFVDANYFCNNLSFYFPIKICILIEVDMLQYGWYIEIFTLQFGLVPPWSKWMIKVAKFISCSCPALIFQRCSWHSPLVLSGFITFPLNW